MHIYFMNIGLIPVQAAIAKFLDFTNEMAVIRAAHLSLSLSLLQAFAMNTIHVHTLVRSLCLMSVKQDQSYSFMLLY